MLKDIRFNLHDLNFILTFIGFAVVTTYFDGISSILYRGFAFAVAIICLFLRRFRFPKLSGPALFIIVLLLCFDFKAAGHLLLRPTIYTAPTQQALLFIFGVVLAPIMAFISGHKKIHWNTILILIELLLLATIIKGVVLSDPTEMVRADLNNRQGTLAFGGNSAYLLILSCCLLRFSTQITNQIFRKIWQAILILGIVVSIYGLARAGSRGPLIGAIAGLLFILLTLSIRYRLLVIGVGISSILFFGISFASLEQFAPVLFARTMDTVEEGDTSGRNWLYVQAMDIMMEKPIRGDCPVLINDNTVFYGYHNDFFSVGVCLGITGFISYLIYVGYILRRLLLYRQILKTPHVLFCAAMFFYTVFRSLSGTNLFFGNGECTLILVATSMIVANLNKQNGLLMIK